MPDTEPLTQNPLVWARNLDRAPATGRLLTPLARHLLLLIASHCFTTGRTALLISTMATEMGVADRSARRALAELRDGGAVQVDRRRRRSSVLTLLMDDAPAEPEPQPVEEVTQPDTPAELTATDVRRQLAGPVIDELLAEQPGNPVAAFCQALTEARSIADEHSHLSPKIKSTLTNAVVARAAAETHDLEGKELPRLYKEAKVLGPHGPEWLVTALYHTASADIEGSAASYVIQTARRLRRDAEEVAA